MTRLFELESILSEQVSAGDPWDEDLVLELLNRIRDLKNDTDSGA